MGAFAATGIPITGGLLPCHTHQLQYTVGCTAACIVSEYTNSRHFHKSNTDRHGDKVIQMDAMTELTLDRSSDHTNTDRHPD